eukprot:TRINITY_DN482_c0_g3_i1.p1 TRINITY_DN482_c0_g3~~TRINITY_DN482_c0_g3_i1.p1  ORF type:complete len:855 (-),score=313.98 TRINITY_DN482_c0_g3_i1:70-2634(-)
MTPSFAKKFGRMEDCLVSCHHNSLPFSQESPAGSEGGIPLQPPPADSRLPPDGHEFPPDYKDPGSKDDLNSRKSSSSDQFRALKLLNSNRLITRHDEKSIKSVKAKIAMFQSSPPTSSSQGGVKKEFTFDSSKTRSLTNVSSSSSSSKRSPLGGGVGGGIHHQDQGDERKFQNRSQSLLEIPVQSNAVRRFNSSGYIDAFENRRRSNVCKMKELVIPEDISRSGGDASEAKKIPLDSPPSRRKPSNMNNNSNNSSTTSPAFKRKPFSLHEDSPSPSQPPKARSTPLKEAEELENNPRLLKRSSVEAINRKNILDSCKKSSGLSPPSLGKSRSTIAERKKSFESPESRRLPCNNDPLSDLDPWESKEEEEEEEESMDTIDDSSIKLGEEAASNVNQVLYSSSSSQIIKPPVASFVPRKFSVPVLSSDSVKLREKKSDDPLPSRPSSLVEAAEMKVFEAGNLGTPHPACTTTTSTQDRRAESVSDIWRALEKAEASLLSSNNNSSNSSSNVSAPNHNRMSSIDSTASEESSIPTTPHLYGSVSSLVSGQSNLKDHYGSITSLASSTSLISPQELQGLIDEANQSLEESGTPSHEIMVIVLHREFTAGSIGITLAGGVDYENKDITVHKVIPGTLADRDGRIQKGDRVLSINGRSTKGVTHREALSILKAPRAEVVLVLSRSRSVTPAEYDRSDFSSYGGRPPKILESPLDHKSLLSDLKFVDVPRCPPTTVVLKKEGTGLGFSLEGGKDSPVGDRPLTIKKIFTGGAADKSAILKVGDEILSVNSTDCTRMSRIEAWNFMKKLSDGTASIVVRQKLLETSDLVPPSSSDLPEKSNPNILPGSHTTEETHSKLEANR